MSLYPETWPDPERDQPELFTPGAQQARLLTIARKILAEPHLLNMTLWHKALADPVLEQHLFPMRSTWNPATPRQAAEHCGTVHCIAGHAVAMEGEAGFALAFRNGHNTAGRLLLGEEAASHFFDTQFNALTYLQSVVDAAEESTAALS